MIGTWYENGDRVVAGGFGVGMVIRDERLKRDFDVTRDLVWVKLDMGDNPVAFRSAELELA